MEEFFFGGGVDCVVFVFEDGFCWVFVVGVDCGAVDAFVGDVGSVPSPEVVVEAGGDVLVLVGECGELEWCGVCGAEWDGFVAGGA